MPSRYEPSFEGREVPFQEECPRGRTDVRGLDVGMAVRRRVPRRGLIPVLRPELLREARREEWARGEGKGHLRPLPGSRRLLGVRDPDSRDTRDLGRYERVRTQTIAAAASARR